MPHLNVNTDAVVGFTRKLELFNKTAFPVAVKNALNGAAFDVKQRTMPQTAGEAFEQREKNFFKATSTVIKASGTDVNKMHSTVGFNPDAAQRGNFNQSVQDLLAQEEGGQIKYREFIPMNTARMGNAHGRKVRPKYRLSNITNLVNADKTPGATRQEQFVKSVYAAGQGGFVLWTDTKGKTILWVVDSLKTRVKDRRLDMRLTPLYVYVQHRSVNIKNKTHFMQRASLQSSKRIAEIYIKEAKRIFNRK